MAGIDRMEAYRQAGVDLGWSNVASQIARDICRGTWDFRADGFGRPEETSGNFASYTDLPLDEIRRHPNVNGVRSTDGTGTKPDFYERARNFNGLGHDLMAMMIDDIAMQGAESVLANNCLVISSAREDTMPHVEQLFSGLADSAEKGKVILYTGEIAVHGDRMHGATDFTVDWSGTAEGLVHKDRRITGERVAVGDILYGFEEPISFRCNGISLARNILKAYYGRNWDSETINGVTLAELVAIPSTVYSGIMHELTGGYDINKPALADIHGAAHISGGSLEEKVGRMLRATGHGALIDDPFELPDMMRHCQEIGKVNEGNSKRDLSDEEVLTTWHGGQAFVVAAGENDHDVIISVGAKHGVLIKPIGIVTQEKGIRVLSRGIQKYGEILELSA